MVTVRRLTAAMLDQLTPISGEALIGEEVLLRVGRSGFSLAYAPMERAEWRVFPAEAGFDPAALCTQEAAAYYAAFVDGRFAGGAGIRCEGGWARLGDIRVAAGHRRQGVASALLDACERFTRDRGCYGLRVETSDQNPLLCQFLEHRGYALAGMDRLRLAASPQERRKPLMKRACALYFYRTLEGRR